MTHIIFWLFLDDGSGRSVAIPHTPLYPHTCLFFLLPVAAWRPTNDPFLHIEIPHLDFFFFSSSASLLYVVRRSELAVFAGAFEDGNLSRSWERALWGLLCRLRGPGLTTTTRPQPRSSQATASCHISTSRTGTSGGGHRGGSRSLRRGGTVAIERACDPAGPHRHPLSRFFHQIISYST